MRAYIILGNTREKSNTETLARLFADALTARGVEVTYASFPRQADTSCLTRRIAALRCVLFGKDQP